jgi:D-alanyl-D-alanine carboxypeptidase
MYMKFAPPTHHQKTYLLGACAVLLVSIVVLLKYGPLYRNQVSYSNQNIASSTSSSTKISRSNPLIPPIASSSFKGPVVSVKPPSSSANGNAIGVTSPIYLVGNALTGQIYFSQNINQVNGLASISKLFTAIVAEENMDTNQVIQITPAMLAVYPNSYGIQLGEKFTLGDLLYGMILQSNDNIAEGIAMAYSSPDTYISAPSGTTPSETAFINKMNALSASLGLSQTHFQDASGLADGNVSDAKDLFSFAQYLYSNQPALLGITTTYSYPVATTTDHFGHDFINIDPFVGDPHYAGGKTGRTDLAGETMLSLFNYESKGKNYPIVIIVLHSDLSERQNDSSRLYLEAINAINGN